MVCANKANKLVSPVERLWAMQAIQGYLCRAMQMHLIELCYCLPQTHCQYRLASVLQQKMVSQGNIRRMCVSGTGIFVAEMALRGQIQSGMCTSNCIDSAYNFIDSAYNYIDSAYNFIDSAYNFMDSAYNLKLQLLSILNHFFILYNSCYFCLTLLDFIQQHLSLLVSCPHLLFKADLL